MVVAESRERLSVSKRPKQKFNLGRFNFDKAMVWKLKYSCHNFKSWIIRE
jgi:hypothetical protein